MEEQDYKKLIEAVLFMSQKALSAEEIGNIIGLAAVGKVEEIAKGLASEYKQRDTALLIEEINGKYLFTIKEPYVEKVSSLASGPDISKGALRILAYVSKNNGVLQSEMVKIFGESTYAYVKELVDKEFLEPKRFGRSKKIYITSKFKEYFATEGLQ
ncbi:MAG: SMC-Scp complex subunit ScpB [Candidatus Micrarchaeia archaeon]